MLLTFLCDFCFAEIVIWYEGAGEKKKHHFFGVWKEVHKINITATVQAFVWIMYVSRYHWQY